MMKLSWLSSCTIGGFSNGESMNIHSTLPCEKLEMTDSAKLCSHSEGFCIFAIEKSKSSFSYRSVQLGVFKWEFSKNIDKYTNLWEFRNDRFCECEVVQSSRRFLYSCNQKIMKSFQFLSCTVGIFSNGASENIDKYTALWEIWNDRFCEVV